jgi:hypothetical protein
MTPSGCGRMRRVGARSNGAGLVGIAEQGCKWSSCVRCETEPAVRRARVRHTSRVEHRARR